MIFFRENLTNFKLKNYYYLFKVLLNITENFYFLILIFIQKKKKKYQERFQTINPFTISSKQNNSDALINAPDWLIIIHVSIIIQPRSNQDRRHDRKTGCINE